MPGVDGPLRALYTIGRTCESEKIKSDAFFSAVNSLERWVALDAALRGVMAVGRAFMLVGDAREARCYLQQGLKFSQGFCLPKRYVFPKACWVVCFVSRTPNYNSLRGVCQTFEMKT